MRLAPTSSLEDLPTSIHSRFRPGKVSSIFWAIGTRRTAAEFGSRSASSRTLRMAFFGLRPPRLGEPAVRKILETGPEHLSVANDRMCGPSRPAQPLTEILTALLAAKVEKAITFNRLERRHAGNPASYLFILFSNHFRIACNGVNGWLIVDACADPARWNGTTFFIEGMCGHGLLSASHNIHRSAIFLASSGDVVRQDSLSDSLT